MRLEVQPWEAAALIAIDRAWMTEYIENAKNAPQRPGRGEVPIPSEQDLEQD